MTILVGVNVASVMMMMMVAIVVDVIVTGVMMMVIMAMVVGINVTNVIRTMRRRRRRMVRRMVRRRRRRRAITAINIIATSDDFSRCSRRKGGKNESNENFELHICLEY